MALVFQSRREVEVVGREEAFLVAEELVDFEDGALGRGEGQGAAEKEAFAAVIGHEDEGGVVLLIQPEAGEDPDGPFPAVKRPAEALEDQCEGIEGGGGGGLHAGIIA